jgi:hypothetical protein
MYKTEVRGRLIDGDKSFHQITQEITAPINSKTPLWWYIALFISLSMLIWGAYCIYITLTVGIGTWGVNNSVGWGWEIINFVWWIGIGHAGTAFSIFLLILRQKWRTAINRCCSYVCCSFSAFAYGAPLVVFLYFPLSKYARTIVG